MKQDVINFIVQTIGFAIIYGAVNYEREVKIKVFTSEWWAVIAMLLIGSILLKLNF
jgi:hypothetical protein